MSTTVNFLEILNTDYLLSLLDLALAIENVSVEMPRDLNGLRDLAEYSGWRSIVFWNITDALLHHYILYLLLN